MGSIPIARPISEPMSENNDNTESSYGADFARDVLDDIESITSGNLPSILGSSEFSKHVSLDTVMSLGFNQWEPSICRGTPEKFQDLFISCLFADPYSPVVVPHIVVAVNREPGLSQRVISWQVAVLEAKPLGAGSMLDADDFFRRIDESLETIKASDLEAKLLSIHRSLLTAE